MTASVAHHSAKARAAKAAFFVNALGMYFRMDYCEEHHFAFHDENTGDEHIRTYESVLPNEKFMELVEVAYADNHSGAPLPPTREV